MTELLVTDIANDYNLTVFSEDTYPNNKNYEITEGQYTALKSVNFLLGKKKSEESFYRSTEGTCIISELDTTVPAAKDEYPYISTPSLSVTYDDTKRAHLLEQEVAELRKKRSTSKNLLEFTNVLFNKLPKAGLLNKRAIILNYAIMNNSPLDMADLESCDDEEIDNMYLAIKQYHEINKKKILVTNFIAILICILEHILIKIGFDELKGLSKEITTELIDLEIGDDCEQVASKIGVVNNPVFNIILFIIKIFIKRINIL